MTYTKEQRAEDMEQERNEDIKKANEIDDGAFDAWIADNKDELIASFIDEYNAEWRNFCKIMWNEENE